MPDRLRTQLPTQPRRLHPTERRRRIRQIRVHPDRPGLHPTRHPQPTLLVPRPHRPTQTEVRVIRDPHRIIHIRIRNQRQHRTENLLLRNSVIVIHISKNRRLHKPTLVLPRRPTTTDHHPGTLRLTLRDIPLNPVPLPIRSHRPDLRRRIQRIPDLQRTRQRREHLHHLRITRTRRQHPSTQKTRLPIVQQRRLEQLLTDRRQIQISIIQHNRRRLTPQLQGHRPQQPPTRLPDRPPRRRRPGKRNLVHPRMRHQRRTHLTPRRHKSDRPGRNTRLYRRRSDQHRVQHRLRRRLDHQRAPRRQRRRKVPRHDRTHPADRRTTPHRRPTHQRRPLLLEHRFLDHSRVIAQQHRRERTLERRRDRHRHPVLRTHQLRDLTTTAVQRISKPLQHHRPRRRLPRRPTVRVIN